MTNLWWVFLWIVQVKWIPNSRWKKISLVDKTLLLLRLGCFISGFTIFVNKTISAASISTEGYIICARHLNKKNFQPGGRPNSPQFCYNDILWLLSRTVCSGFSRIYHTFPWFCHCLWNMFTLLDIEDQRRVQTLGYQRRDSTRKAKSVSPARKFKATVFLWLSRSNHCQLFGKRSTVTGAVLD